MTDELIIIGGSAGSLEVLLVVLPQLKADLQTPVVIIMHRKATNDTLLQQLLASKTTIPVREIEEKDVIEKNHIYIAPADYHLLIEKDKTFSLDFSEKVHYSRPSIDVSFESAAEIFKRSLTAILLSGANADGTDGLKTVKKYGGKTIAQDPESAEVDFMPKAAIDAKAADMVLGPNEITMYINQRP